MSVVLFISISEVSNSLLLKVWFDRAVMIADGGNYEGVTVPWIQPRPSWSMFRESSFGIALIDFLDEFSANFSWHRHACMTNSGDHITMFERCSSIGDNSEFNVSVSDSLIITKPPSRVCPNRWKSNSRSVTTRAITAKIVLMCICCVLFLVTSLFGMLYC